MGTDVRFFHSDMPSAPTLTNAASSLLGILRACLVDGMSSITLTSLSVSSGTATATKTSHGYEMAGDVGPIIEISGATPSELNGVHRILSVPSADTFTFSTDATDGTATGTITAKIAAAGWTEVYTGTNKAVFRPSDTGTNQMYLRVSDPSGSVATLRSYESMSDIDNGTGRIPSTDIGNWLKSSSASAADWFAVADYGAIHLWTDYDGSANIVAFYGDLADAQASDTLATVLTRNDQTTRWWNRTCTDQAWLHGTLAGVSSALTVSNILGVDLIGSTTAAWNGSKSLTPSGEVILTPMAVWDGDEVRGHYPGAYDTPHADNVVPEFFTSNGIPFVSKPVGRPSTGAWAVALDNWR